MVAEDNASGAHSEASPPGRESQIDLSTTGQASDHDLVARPLIVALGASAGGLEALTEFFDHMPADNGMAFVVVTHQQANRNSLLPELLARHTSMGLREIRDGDRLLPNQIYVAPPCHNVLISQATLQLVDPETEHLSFPIDTFFRSLAEDQGDNAVCLVLSGTGTDGSLGLKAIKGQAGLAVVQDIESAKYSGMPQSAIATGLVDHVLPTAEMPRQLLAYAARHRGAPITAGDDTWSDVLPKIFRLLRARTGNDFSAYKKSTVCRRIERRMSVHQLDAPQRYASYLQHHPHELDCLFKELLISVTNFFRDRPAFESLKESMLALLHSKPEGYQIRAWVPGCSTGEEAYSVAIVIRECLTQLDKNYRAQVFGTDLDASAIETARAACYPNSIIADVSPERIRGFFAAEEEDHYRINNEIREMVVFAPQNVIADPPFTKLDLVSCRNLLIYLNSDLQKQLVPMLHYALNPDGLLLLGPSESIDGFRDLFAVIDKKWKLFQRKPVAESSRRMWLPLTGTQGVGQQLVGPAKLAGRSVNELLHEHLASTYIPPTVVVNERGDIIHVQGKTGLYLELPTGQATTNLIEMAREGLQLDLAATLRRAVSSEQPIVNRDIEIKTNDGVSRINVTIKRIRDPEPIRGMFTVTFEPAFPPSPARRSGASKSDGGRGDRHEHELRHLKESLQATVEEYQTAIEELKSTNEELQSTNEELQSANEELETSKEEMQSLNEEMQTVNAELQSKLDELSQSNDDMQNLLNSTDVATLFLDNDLRVRRFTTSARKLFKVRDMDVGRHIGEIVSLLDYRELDQDADHVIQTLNFAEKEVETLDGTACYRMRIMPYRTAANVIDGAVLTFVDINEIREARDFSASIVATVSEPLLVLDTELRIVSANPAFRELVELEADDVEGRFFYDFDEQRWNTPELRDLLFKVLPDDAGFQDYQFLHEFRHGRRLTLSINARRLRQRPNRPGRILLAIRVMPHEIPSEGGRPR